MTLSEIFWTFLITSIIGFSLAACRLAYKSKCQTIDIGIQGIHIVRDTIGEEKIDAEQIVQQKSVKDNTEEKV